jgi:hypothetical protein
MIEDTTTLVDSILAADETTDPDEKFSDTAVVCRNCFGLEDGVLGGRFVMWVLCDDCRETLEAQALTEGTPLTKLDRLLALLKKPGKQ